MIISRIVARPVDVPMRRPLATGGGTVATAPLVLIDLVTDGNVVGRSYVFVYTPMALVPVARLIEEIGAILAGDEVAPFAIEAKVQRRFRLLGAQGLTGMAMAGIDIAAWDALAKSRDLPLVRLLGGAPRPIPAYNSCGLGIIGPERAAAEAKELSQGFRAIKVRLGYPDLETDLRVLDAVGDSVERMTDYNQSLTVPEAIRRARKLDGAGVSWIEEPVSAGDFVGHAAVRAAAATPVQIGENWWGPHDMAKSIAAGASDLAMADAVKIGGVTGWLRAAALAESAGLPLSSHLFPELSAHLLAVSPTAHWLEYVDWAEPVLKSGVRIEDGYALASEAPGIGLEWCKAY